MFVQAIDKANEFTRAIHSIARYHGSSIVVPGAATLFFVNDTGWALTCKHVAEQLAQANALLTKYNDFRAKRLAALADPRAKRLVRDLERQFGFHDGVVVELLNCFVDCIEGPLNAQVMVHPDLDIALLHFTGYTRLLCTHFPVFARTDADLKQGLFLCRLGYPFAEFANFQYDAADERISWTNAGRNTTPRFPIEGMVTRHLVGNAGAVIGFEMSTPGLRGQSGGPAFDPDGRVWGMQSSTNHLDLDFDVDIEVLRQGRRKKVHHTAALHVGHCVHVSALKAFMRQHGVPFQEG